ncbi:hypothetical protein K3N28_12655 [Glycomyces sp. TRM65418]|uniref:hypothetical protein n=1 Tax=Glycomyces sp. TRM65418 TaxID=2867006 RepID=UPI001CE535F0|nr:hypothetical protein [Glycomyces sp. TRM65418]MCC3763915.1 hypothetical protein [Glycomyces sp. TRM65418]QZD53617.1 hypothetical protein K3N28_12585 [Glycomyces sp. TRM65418]
MSDVIEEPAWDENAPRQDDVPAVSGMDAWRAVTGQGSPGASGDGGMLHQAVDGYRNPDGAANQRHYTGLNTFKSVAAPVLAVQNTVTNVGKIESLTDWDGYANLVTGMAGDITAVQGAAEEFWSLVENITDPKFDPLQWLAGSLIEFLVQVFQPLEDLIGIVSGNETRMKTSARMWETVAKGAPEVSDFIAAVGDDSLADWQGGDGDAARTRVAEAAEVINGLGYMAVGMEGLLLCMADVAKALRQDIVDLLAKGVSWALTRLLPQVAAGIATFGASVATAIADAVYKVASLLMRAFNRIRQATDIFGKAAQVLAKVGEVLEKIKPVLEFLKTNRTAIVTGAGLAEQAAR